MQRLYIDIETRSLGDIKAGAYAYAEAPGFEVLLVAWAFDDGPVTVTDLTAEDIPRELLHAMRHADMPIYAHNAQFERVCLGAAGYSAGIHRWVCTATHARYAGLPGSLAAACEALGTSAKMEEGKELLRLFTMPNKRKPADPFARPEDHPDKWELFKQYAARDVEAMRDMVIELEARWPMPASLVREYQDDQRVNDTGLLVDTAFARKCQAVAEQDAKGVKEEAARRFGVQVTSTPQVKAALARMGVELESLNKDTLSKVKGLPAEARDLLALRAQATKASVKKYAAALEMASPRDNRARGLLMFYGASRTGRWAGRGVQVQNLPRAGYTDEARADFAALDWDTLSMLYDVPRELSGLIRSVFTAPEGRVLVVADFSAIEARVLAWLAGEKWRLDVFAGHGKIYEASASAMFKIPLEAITKDSKERQLGKVAELALGYQGSIGALTSMGADRMGLTEEQMLKVVAKWRAANPAITALWQGLEKAALKAVVRKGLATDCNGIVFHHDGTVLSMRLPSGRKLHYFNARTEGGRLVYDDAGNGGLVRTESYGGKLTENAVQAIARDLLAASVSACIRSGHRVVCHVHDEVVAEAEEAKAEDALREMLGFMATAPAWADGLPLKGEGFITKHYKK